MKIYMKVLYVLSWIPVMAFRIVGVLMGLIAVPVALLFPRWPKLLWLWGNDEDDPRVDERMQWWRDKAAASKNPIRRWFPNFYWYTVRNPFNNMRYIFKDREATFSGSWKQAAMNARNLKNKNVSFAYRWAHSGPFAGYRAVWLHDNNKWSEIWIGWKIGSGTPGLGFTSQFRIKREWNE
jgi:hypothetical protein